MTERGLDNIRIATKVLASFVVPLGIVFLLIILWVYFGLHAKIPVEMDPQDVTVLDVLFFILVLLTIVLPIVMLRRELQKRKLDDIQIQNALFDFSRKF